MVEIERGWGLLRDVKATTTLYRSDVERVS